MSELEKEVQEGTYEVGGYIISIKKTQKKEENYGDYGSPGGRIDPYAGWDGGLPVRYDPGCSIGNDIGSTSSYRRFPWESRNEESKDGCTRLHRKKNPKEKKR